MILSPFWLFFVTFPAMGFVCLTLRDCIFYNMHHCHVIRRDDGWVKNTPTLFHGQAFGRGLRGNRPPPPPPPPKRILREGVKCGR